MNTACYSMFPFQPGPRTGLGLHPSGTFPVYPTQAPTKNPDVVTGNGAGWSLASCRAHGPTEEGGKCLFCHVLRCGNGLIHRWLCVPDLRELRALYSLAAGHLRRGMYQPGLLRWYVSSLSPWEAGLALV